MKNITLKEIKPESGMNIYVQVEMENVFAIFRINFSNEKRKNASYDNYKALDTYFEGWEGTDRTNAFFSYETSRMTDLLLFVERKKQWILEQVMRSRK